MNACVKGSPAVLSIEMIGIIRLNESIQNNRETNPIRYARIE
jgi:hypothetical protein